MSKIIKTCWVLTEGMAGTEGQCVGLARALGVEPDVKRITLKTPWKQLSPWLNWGHGWALSDTSDSVAPPWPDVLIASGRKSVGVARHIKAQSGGKTFLVQVQDPKVSAQHFDMVIVPQHDDLRGDNVMVTTGALHRLTREALASEAEKWRQPLSHLPTPRVAVLIGGNSKAHRMTSDVTQRMVEGLLKLDAGLMITASRRTGEENSRFLQEKLKGDHIFFWDGNGDNPYLGFLGLADYIIVTEDSVSMATEALFTGKPVYTVALEGGARRLNKFHDLLKEQDYTRPFNGSLDPWHYQPLDDVERMAQEIERKIESRA